MGFNIDKGTVGPLFEKANKSFGYGIVVKLW